MAAVAEPKIFRRWSLQIADDSRRTEPTGASTSCSKQDCATSTKKKSTEGAG